MSRNASLTGDRFTEFLNGRVGVVIMRRFCFVCSSEGNGKMIESAANDATGIANQCSVVLQHGQKVTNVRVRGYAVGSAARKDNSLVPARSYSKRPVFVFERCGSGVDGRESRSRKGSVFGLRLPAK